MTFRTTRWSLVLTAAVEGDGREKALQELCSLYWPPVYAFFRSSGHDEEAALDLTQGLFAHLLERDDLAKADPERGRFRAYLRTCARHFVANQHAAERAQKRGGGAKLLSLDLADARAAWASEPVDRQTPEQAFERQFAQALLGAVLDQLAAEYAERGRQELFASLRSYLEVDGGPAYQESAEALGMTEGAVKVAVYRMRGRFREMLVQEVRHTLVDPDEAADEIGQLLAALRGGDPPNTA